MKPVNDEPESENPDVDEEKRNTSGKACDPVGRFLEQGALVCLFFVDVTGSGMPESFDGFAMPFAHRSQDVHGCAWAENEELLQINAIEPQSLCLLSGDDGGSAGAVIEHREFAKEIAPCGDFEHDALTGVVFEKHFHFARADHVDRVARLSVVENDLPGIECDDIELRGQFRALVIVEQLEQGDFFKEIGFGTHGVKLELPAPSKCKAPHG